MALTMREASWTPGQAQPLAFQKRVRRRREGGGCAHPSVLPEGRRGMQSTDTLFLGSE